MKKFLVSIALASSALISAVPAAAQYRDDRQTERYDDRRSDDRDYDQRRGDDRRWDDRGGRGDELKPRLDRLSIQISNSERRGMLTRREGQILRTEHANIWALARQFARTGGYDRRERMILDRRIDRLQERLRFERRDDDRRNYR